MCERQTTKDRSFSVTDKRCHARLLGEFFHSNIFCPLPIPNLGGHVYFVTSKDDHFFYLMNCKNDVSNNIQRLCKIVKYETGN